MTEVVGNDAKIASQLPPMLFDWTHLKSDAGRRFYRHTGHVQAITNKHLNAQRPSGTRLMSSANRPFDS